MRDFKQLSPIDFENLVRDLLQAEMKLRMESFGPGKDGGVDFRFSRGTRSTIVQVKHFSRSSTRALIRASKLENAKVAALQPRRYILATSLSLTPHIKKQLVAAMPDAPLHLEDVMGSEDIDNLLTLHPKVLRSHFKLWLTSTETLDRIVHSGVYNRTDAELDAIKSLVPRFVQNRSVAAAEALLRRRGALIIAGEPGVGKTTLARILTWLHLDQDWRVFVVDDLKEAMEVCETHEKRMIFFDDFLGQISLTNDTVRHVDQRLHVFLERVQNNKNLRFVLTTRSYLLAQAQLQSTRLASEKVVASELILNIGMYTRGIRAQILFNHIYFSELTAMERRSLLSGDFYLKMIDHRNFSPRLIELLTSSDYLRLQKKAIRSVVQSVLDNPAELWETPYRSHLSEDSRTLMLALFFCEPRATVEDMFAAFKRITGEDGSLERGSSARARFRHALKPLEGSIIEISDGNVAFSNPGVKDFLGRVIVEDELLSLVVRTLEKFKELDNAWDFYKEHRDACALQMRDGSVWAGALDRIRTTSHTPVIVIVRLGLEISTFLDENDAALRITELALQQLEEFGIDSSFEYSCRHALEYFSLLDAEDRKKIPSSKFLVSSAARMLSTSGDQLLIDEIEAVANAISRFGGAPELSKPAARAAMIGFLDELPDRLEEFTSTDDLATFERQLASALTRCQLEFDDPSRELVSRRQESLAQREAQEDEDGYSPTSSSKEKSEATDAELKSLFATLIADEIAD